MKKLALFAAIAFTVSLTACKKDYTCSCTAFGITVEDTWESVKKSDAEDQCNESEAEAQVADPNASCTLSAAK